MNFSSSKFKIILYYTLFGILWITFSDKILFTLVKNLEQLNTYQSYKGFFYIFVTSLLLYFLMSLYERKRKKIDSTLSSVFNVLPDLLFIINKDGTITDYRSQSDDILYLKPQNFINKKMQDVLPKDKSKLFDKKIEETLNSDSLQIFEYELEIDKQKKYFEARMAQLPEDDNIMIIIRDSTEEVKYQNDLREKNILLIQQSKMATMGEMIGSIAHQWKQPLSLLSMSNGMLRISREDKTFFNEKQLDEAVDNIDLAIDNISHTIDDFRNFYNPNKEKTLFTISNAFDSTFKLLSSQFKNSKIEIIKNIEEHTLYGSQNELQQTLMNLLKNAKEELVKINSKEKKLIFIDTYEKNNNIIIKIKDNANGVPEKFIDNIFESYFTTKEKEGGSGIGLYMCKQIIEGSMKGSISVKNQEYIYENITCKGAEFIISLPLDLRHNNIKESNV